AAANNIDVIITDHHTIPELLPEKAHAILHPKLDDIYPFKELTGAGVALKLAQAIIQEYKIDDEKLKDEIVNLATLGTVADLGILQDENRLIVKKGLKNMVNTSSAGLKRIMELAEIKDNYELDTHAIGFKIAPRINAAGRIGDPYVALKLLLLDDYDESALTLGNELEDLNSKRKNITEEILKQTEIMFGDKENLPCVLIAEDSGWHIGVLGLVAGKLAERYGRPSIVMQDFGETLVGSARSIRGFNITDALSNISDVLISFGGHAKAAGFNLEKKNLEAFKEKFIAYSEKTLDKDTITPILEIDCELKEQDMTFDFLNKIEDLKPYGVGNEDPIFHVSNIEPHFVSTVGKENSHLKFTVYYGGKTIQVIGFYMGQFAEQVRQHKKIDLACHMDKNTWQSKTYIQFRAVDIRGRE
ncbi:MAG: DHHA1 domain-containing protein, partial [Candidatus Gracilibacteria bacterium]